MITIPPFAPSFFTFPPVLSKLLPKKVQKSVDCVLLEDKLPTHSQLYYRLTKVRFICLNSQNLRQGNPIRMTASQLYSQIHMSSRGSLHKVGPAKQTEDLIQGLPAIEPLSRSCPQNQTQTFQDSESQSKSSSLTVSRWCNLGNQCIHFP